MSECEHPTSAISSDRAVKMSGGELYTSNQSSQC